MARKKRQRRKKETFASYVVEIAEWDWSYSFGLEAMRHAVDPYSEFRHLEISGRILVPRGVKASSAELTFIPSDRYKEENRQEAKPLAVGSLHVYNDILHGLLSMPTDGLDPVLQMLIARKMRYVFMNGEALRYRKALVRHYQITTKYDEDDILPDEDDAGE